MLWTVYCMYTNQQVHFEAGITDCVISFLFAMFIKHRTYPYPGYIQNVINQKVHHYSLKTGYIEKKSIPIIALWWLHPGFFRGSWGGAFDCQTAILLSYLVQTFTVCSSSSSDKASGTPMQFSYAEEGHAALILCILAQTYAFACTLNFYSYSLLHTCITAISIGCSYRIFMLVCSSTTHVSCQLIDWAPRITQLL